MGKSIQRNGPGQVRDAILQVLTTSPNDMTVKQIEKDVTKVIGATATSSVRSYLWLKTLTSLYAKSAEPTDSVTTGRVGGLSKASEKGRSIQSEEATKSRPLGIGQKQTRTECNIHLIPLQRRYR